MQFYVGDYIQKTMHLTTEQHGAYMLLLMALWNGGASLPNDAARLARITRVSPKRWPMIWAEIASFFTVTDGLITQDRLTKEHQKVLSLSQERKNAGSKGGKAKALKTYDVDLASATILPEQNSTIPEPEPEPERKSRGASAPTTRSQVIEVLCEQAGIEAVESFVTYRSKHKSKALTLTAAKRLAGELQAIRQAGIDADDALGLAEERGWASINLEWYRNAKGLNKTVPFPSAQNNIGTAPMDGIMRRLAQRREERT
jgi:uncharacterized protein YdaU (DUF1376 family)